MNRADKGALSFSCYVFFSFGEPEEQWPFSYGSFMSKSSKTTKKKEAKNQRKRQTNRPKKKENTPKRSTHEA
jgi:hypothetical protein